MRPGSTIVLVFLSLSGCVQTADDFKDALPRARDVQIEVPQEGAGGGAGSHELALLGERSALYQITRDVSRGINGAVWILLTILEEVAENPPTTVTDEEAVWGPHTPALSPLTWRLVVDRTGDDQYEYSLDAKPRDGDEATWVAILSGNSHVVGPDRSTGILVAHCDDASTLDPNEFRCTGLVTASWDVTGSPKTLSVSFRGWSDGDFFGHPIDADYQYLENDDGSGELSFGATADLDDEGAAAEDVAVTSRWDATGAGRGDAFASGGDIPADVGQVVITECWDRTFGRAYYTDSVGLAPTEGDADSCVFADAKLPAAQ